jgi:hypothetical protein
VTAGDGFDLYNLGKEYDIFLVKLTLGKTGKEFHGLCILIEVNMVHISDFCPI